MPALAKISYHWASTIFHSATRSTFSFLPSRTRNGAVLRLTPIRAAFSFAADWRFTPAGAGLLPVSQSNNPMDAPIPLRPRQALVRPALLERLGLRVGDPGHKMRGRIVGDGHAGAAIAVMAVGLDPAGGAHVGNVVHAGHRFAALSGEDPLAMAVEQPPIAGRRIGEPAAAPLAAARDGRRRRDGD